MASEMHTHYMGLAGGALQTAIAVTAGLSFVAFGYGQGDVGGYFIEDGFREYFPQFSVAIDAGAIISTWNIGCFIGAFVTIFLGDRLGRKGTVITGLVIETIGKIIQCSSFGIGQYVAGRMIAGIGNG
jgi:MFS family permease